MASLKVVSCRAKPPATKYICTACDGQGYVTQTEHDGMVWPQQGDVRLMRYRECPRKCDHGIYVPRSKV